MSYDEAGMLTASASARARETKHALARARARAALGHEGEAAVDRLTAIVLKYPTETRSVMQAVVGRIDMLRNELKQETNHEHDQT
jgi:hypothetical protein